MKSTLRIESLSEVNYDVYIALGRTSYVQHYSHLWKHGDPSVYLDENFTRKALIGEMASANAHFFIVYDRTLPIGIVKIKKNAPLEPFTAQDAMLLDKIYILKEFSGKGFGNVVLDFVVKLGKKWNKKRIWLEAMQQGPALRFYLNNGFKIHAETLHGSPQVVIAQKAMYILIRMIDTD